MAREYQVIFTKQNKLGVDLIPFLFAEVGWRRHCFFYLLERADYTESCQWLNYSCQPIILFVFSKWKRPFFKNPSFDSDKSSTTEIRESAASFSGGNGWFASSWKVSPPSIFWNYTAWLACRLELLISDTSGFLKCKCRNCWRNLGFCLCAQTSPRGSRWSAAVRQELLFPPPLISDSNYTRLLCSFRLVEMLLCLFPLR